MATEMTKPMRAHTDKILGTFEDILHTVITVGVATAERDQLTAELDEIRAQRSQIPTATAAGAGRWTKAAAARTKKLRKKHAKTLAAAEARKQQRATSRRARTTTATTAACTATTTDDNADQALDLPYTDEHLELLRHTTALLRDRSQSLQRSARVTTGALHAAIRQEIHRVNLDYSTLPRMSLTATAACHDYHQAADEQWKEHGAEVLIRRPCLR
ncbi:Hypothetical protein CGLY_16650 (plasmid) [Corynebacterium glyciniphilum AJ 3170]|uniref:Uncharacterized protein n=1 Tax=Corynebacterium glyciniphilum AJ 3170 TaxID=1404245 RepID=X5DR63_9CORY|nr:hypothetical protein [Corynebacterium glyciniphilum]AHW65703.1 Hypothetical protein CGLY_16650 [Corynebacterium glyciniphilum AJ 3170]